jgi:hypothetical protein
MGKVRVTIEKLKNGNYSGESYYNHDTGLATVGGGNTLYSEMTSNGKIISFHCSTWRLSRQNLLDENINLYKYANKTEKLHYNAHLKALQEFLNPDQVIAPIYTKYIVLERGKASPELLDARPIKNSLEIKGKYCTYAIRSGEWVKATEYKLKWLEKYNELQTELKKTKEQLFCLEVNNENTDNI